MPGRAAAQVDLDKKCGYLAGILNEALRDGVVAQGQRLDQLAQQAPLDAITEDGLIDPKYRDYADARTTLGNGDSIVAKELIDAVEQVVGDGSLVNRACATMIQRLRRFTNTAQFQTTDQDLVAGLQAADNRDPVVANVMLDRLKIKASTTRRLSAVVNKMRTQLQEMTRDYIIHQQQVRGRGRGSAGRPQARRCVSEPRICHEPRPQRPPLGSAHEAACTAHGCPGGGSGPDRRGAGGGTQ